MIDLMVHAQLRFLRDFLSHLERDIALEWSEIEARNEEGAFHDFGDYEAAMDYPLFREEFAAKSLFNELNILVEETLHSAAASAWRAEQASQGANSLPKPEWELPIGKIWELIENHHNVNRKNLPGWDVYNKLREINNAFKHRRGFRRFSDLFQSDKKTLEDARHKAKIDNAKRFIDEIAPFILSVAKLAINDMYQGREQ
jgi:hypothetical protein